MRGYDTAEYAHTRLVETIITYNKEPVFVNKVYDKDGVIFVRFAKLLEDVQLDVPLSDCDINPVQLGYINHKSDALYIMRTPMRRDWRQGLRMLNIVGTDGSSPRAVPYSVIAHTIMGRFPSFKSVLERLNSSEKIHRLAYSRDFAVNKKGDITYKGLIDIGTVSMSNGSISINDNCGWIVEALDESLEAA